MAQYMFMLFDSEDWYDLPPEEWASSMKLHDDFSKAVEAAGATITGGEALERTTTATTLRQQDGGDVLITDGPFIETKEALGGFYLVECRDLEQALELAKLCPAGTIEVRPVLAMPSETPPA